MKLIFILIVLISILLELTTALPFTSLDPYGRVHRNSRMSRTNYRQQEGDEDDEDADDEDNEDEQDDDIYPPDFAKLFPNPDGRPVGPDSYGAYAKHHPGNHQPGKPNHGPGSSVGPASLRGPIQAQQGQQQGGVGHHGRPSYDAPPPRRSYQSGPPPSYHRGPPPSGHGPPRRGPPPQYRNDIEETDEDIIQDGRQLHFAKQRVVGYPSRRVVTYPFNNYYGNGYVNRNRYVVGSSYPRHQVTRVYPTYSNRYYPRHTPVIYGRNDIDSVENAVPFPGPVVVPSRAHSARIYNPWSHSPLRADAYNPQFVFNPTEMRARRRFRYHPSQRLPYQRIPIYSGTWGNPRNNYVHSFTGGHYGGSYYSTRL